VVDEPDMRRYHDWLRRAVPMIPWGELWAEQPDHPARAPIADLAATLGREVPTDFILVHTLLYDLLHAAGGVELHAGRVLAALDLSQSKYDALVAEHPEFAWQPDVGQHFPIEESLAWDYPNLLTWLRGVEERIDRQVFRRPARVGLLPAIGDDQLRAEVEQAAVRFKARVGDERRLANYGLHAAKLPNPSTPNADLHPDGTHVVPIPDPPEEVVYVFDQFTYDEGRDLRTFAREALAATEELMDGILSAFERANDRVTMARAAVAAEEPASQLDDRGGT
jgi:hypothetical protein